MKTGLLYWYQLVGKYMEELLTLREAAQILKVHPNTLRLWDKKGILVAVRIGEKRVRRYKKADLEKFIKK